ncbi:MAG TPA: alpha-amylase family glycosyl hydrolase [Polyangiaceae bacterium]
MNRSFLLGALFAALAAGATSSAAGCGSDQVNNPKYGSPPDAGTFDPGQGNGGSGYGSGGSGNAGSPPTGPVDAGPPTCADADKRCQETFTYPYGGETSVELRGNYDPSAWVTGTPMSHVGNVWTATVPVPWNQPVEYKFFVNGTTWTTDPTAPASSDDAGDVNNLKAPLTCPGSYTCSAPGPTPAGVFDWRDAVLYFVFVDRFLDGDPTNNCNVANTASATNYQGGDWKGVTQKIDDGYFNALGVNTLWITVPIKNADDVADPGVAFNNGAPVSDGHEYSAYHGYWPDDPTKTETCFGTDADLKALVTAAHAKNLKVLFDYAMVHVHTESTVYQTHKNDSPAWFTPSCVCGASGCGNFDTSCWFTDYLAHYDYTNPATRTFSINAAIALVQANGNDAFRLDAIKQVDPSWLAGLRPAIDSQVLATQNPKQRFYMVGETYDFQNRSLIRSMIDTSAKLDGQFDFPLRIRLVEAMLMRSTQNMLTPDDTNWSRNAPPGLSGLAQFLDSNDAFYPADAVMSTFVGNHDLPRSIHYAEQTLPSWLSAGSPQNPSAADGKNAAWSNQPALEADPNAYQRLANAFAVMFTTKGAPLVYYGDEVGLPGAGDPDNRRMMQWSGYSADQQALHDRIAALLAIRAAHPALRRGSRTTLTVDADLWVFSTTTAVGSASDTVYVAINRSDADRSSTSIPSGLPELLTHATSTGNDPIPARQTRIYSGYVPSAPDAGADGG